MADSSAEGGAARLFGRLGCAIKSIRGPPKTELELLLDSVILKADSIDLDRAAMEGVVRFCAEEADRRIIMRHVHSCLAMPQSSEWRCVYLALQVLEQLFSKGPPELVTEAATGAHFDVVQRLSFLEKYEMGIDLRVQSLIRRRATAMKADWIQRQAGEELGGGDHACTAPGSQEAKTPATRSTKSYNTAFSRSSDDAGGSGDEGPGGGGGRPAPPAGAYSSDPRVRSSRRPMDDSTDDEDDNGTSRQAKPRQVAVAKKPSPPAPEVDLMGLMDVPAPVPTAAVTKPTPEPAISVDLLGEGGASSSDSKFLDPHGPDWLEKAQAHGLYSAGKPGEGDLLPAPPAEASLIDF
jgi:hypothetical protein